MRQITVFLGAAIIALTLTIITPASIDPLLDAREILTVTSLLFSIFAGFSLAYLLSRFNSVRELVATETALLATLHQFFLTLNKDYGKMIAVSIKEYVHEVLKHPRHHHVRKVREQYYALFKPIKRVREEEMKNTNYVYNRSLALMAELGSCRRKTLVLVSTRLNTYHWLTLLLLSIMLTCLLLIVKTASVISLITTAALLLAIFTVLLVIWQLEEFLWNADIVWVEPYHRVLEIIDKNCEEDV